MRIISRKEALNVLKPEEINVSYYLFSDYEVHLNEQAPHTTQVWHHHEKIWETLFIIEGELIAKWKEDDKEKSQVLKVGDLVQTERSPHTFENSTDSIVKFLVIKLMPSGKDFKEILKTDKILD